MSVVVTGGAGYIGSHVCKALKEAGFIPVVFDNFKQGHSWAVQWGPSFEGELCSPADLEACFDYYLPVGIIHLASHINVRESVLNPGKYYYNNVLGTLTLLEVMRKKNVKNIVFSSSAAVYGIPAYNFVPEESPLHPINPYGHTKAMGEQLLADFASLGIHSISLRYFNAAGADPAGEIGEAHDPETHLIPSLFLTLLEEKEELSIYGTDHPTPDGTAIRDYIHVSDLAEAHVKSLQKLLTTPETLVLNLGTGRGHSIYELMRAAEKITGKKVPFRIEQKKLSDPPILVANAQKAYKTLNWRPHLSDLVTILETAWRWHSQKVKILT